MKSLRIILLLVGFAYFHNCAQAQAVSETASQKLVSLMVGKWVGTTVFRQSDPQKGPLAPTTSNDPVVTRATWATVVPGKKTGTFVMQITWDEIDKLDDDQITTTFDLDGHRLTYKYKDDDSHRDFRQLEGIDKVLARGGGQITAIEQEPHSERQRRITISVTRNLWMRQLEERDNSNAPWTEQQRILLTRDPAATR